MFNFCLFIECVCVLLYILKFLFHSGGEGGGGGNDDDDEDNRERMIAAEKREAKEFIQQQFAIRRGGNSLLNEVKQKNSQDAKKAQVFAAESTDTKVRGLTVQVNPFFLISN